jgi:transposase
MRAMVAVGVDTHRDWHVAVAIDQLGGKLAEETVRADAAGYERLVRWALELGQPVFAVEGTGSYGAGLTRHLEQAGVQVFEVERPRRSERRRGKSDVRDAEAAARRLLARDGLFLPRGTGGVRDVLRELLLERRGLVQMRTAELNRLQAMILTGPEQLRSQLRGLNGLQIAERVWRQQPASNRVRRITARIRSFTRDLAELDRELDGIVSPLAPALIAECGVGPVSAAQLIVSAADPKRMRTEAAFAALAGTSPVEASSGHTTRHRLNRGGDRQLNRALHIISLNRIRHHPETAAYYARLRDRGKTPREARRIIKRALARHFHNHLKNLNTQTLTP